MNFGTLRCSRRAALLLAAFFLANAPQAAPADAQQPRPYYPAVTLPRTAQFDLRSTVNGRDYRIFVSTPAAPPPASGYPVLYLLDGNAHFATAVMRLAGSMVLVGIGYPIADTVDPLARRYDLTPPPLAGSAPPAHLAGPQGSVYGGQEEFLQFIEQQVVPKIEREFPADPRRRAIFGMGLGGLEVLHILLTRPNAYQAYIAASPSASWQQAYILDEERRFERTLCKRGVRAALFIGLGGLGEAGAQAAKEPSDDANAVSKQIAARLAALADCRIEVTLKVYEDEAHNTVSPAVISRIARFWRAAQDAPK